MREEEVLSKAAETFVNTPKVIEIPIEPKNKLDKVLMNWGLKSKVVKYPIRKILVGNRFRIASKAVKMPLDIFKSKDVIQTVMDASFEINDDLIYVCAVAIQNNRHEPSKTLLNQLRWVNDSVFADILDQSLSMIDVQSFIKSIVLVKGTDILTERKTSLQDTREIIARTDKSMVTESILA